MLLLEPEALDPGEGLRKKGKESPTIVVTFSTLLCLTYSMNGDWDIQEYFSDSDEP